MGKNIKTKGIEKDKALKRTVLIASVYICFR
jgi:hypothetical protein